MNKDAHSASAAEKKILIPHYFKELDYKILSEKYEVDRFYFYYNQVCVIKLFWKIKNYDLNYSWFGNIWAAFAVIFSLFWRKKSIVIAGGHDVASVPEINYGMLQNPFLRPFARVAFKYADMVIPVSKNTESRLLKFVKPRKHRMIYNAVDCPGLTGSINKEKIVLTVGMVGKISSLVKGHFLFLEVARRIPDVKFILYDKHEDNTIEKLREKAAKNVEFIDHSSRKDLLELYRKSMIYAQLSYDESFGVSAIEAMACGCTPFVTSNGALPEIVGNCGVIVNSMDP